MTMVVLVLVATAVAAVVAALYWRLTLSLIHI